ncbi:lipase member H-like [Schistocerca gregaria]|uniref:lipase member H-like n=1 Tax=Schistocerca gregaria TaxID=7010 RepID=UPI00211DEA02|nr:lipase member H-like [Schistocerca gregaria]
MKVIALIVTLSTTISAHTCRWELIPTRNNSPEPLPNVLVDPNDVIFQLYTLANPNSPQNLTPVGSYVGKFVASKPTKFVIHGWKNEADEMREIRDGMDPAFPLYSLEPIENRLDASDASFVQVIHTNGGLLGWKDPMGTADFYPNGGTFQPGCGIDIGYTCSHARSFYYFAESITTEIGFTAHQCGSWNDYMSGNCAGNPTALMGETTPTSVSGTYYLATASYPPYALEFPPFSRAWCYQHEGYEEIVIFILIPCIALIK